MIEILIHSAITLGFLVVIIYLTKKYRKQKKIIKYYKLKKKIEALNREYERTGEENWKRINMLQKEIDDLKKDVNK